MLRFENDLLARIPVLYPEDLANFRYFCSMLTARCGVADLEHADFVLVPLFLPALELLRLPVSDILGGLATLESGKPHLVFSSWDTYPRPARFQGAMHLSAKANPALSAGARVRRRNPFDLVARYERADGELGEYYRSAFRAFDERFVLVGFESTIDQWQGDFGVFPTLPACPVRPAARRRDLLCSFVGTTTFPALAPDHVRGSGTAPVWRDWARRSLLDSALAQSPPKESAAGFPRAWFVGSGDAARRRFGPRANQRSLARRSVFTLCPAGWARWSFRVTEAVLGGSIPVILSDFYRKPFSAALPWDRFSVTWPENRLAAVFEELAGLPGKRIRELQRGLARWQGSFAPAGWSELVIGELRRLLHERKKMSRGSR